MKPKKHLLLFFIVSAMYFWVTSAHAATMTVTPSASAVGEKVTVSITGHIAGYVSGSFTVDFGDNSPIQKSQVYSNSVFGGVVETYTTSHVYSSPGDYVITGRSIGGNFIDPPFTVTAKTTIDGVNPNLPRGLVGDEYTHTLKPLTGNKTYTYKRAKGKLPPGLTLDIHGRITGIPTKKGQYPFTVRISTPRGATFEQDLLIHVDAGELVVQVTPATINVSVGGPTSQNVTFTVIKPSVAVNETIRSNRGEFYLGGRMVGSINKPLNINLNQQSPSATETFTIPQSVLQAVQSAGTGKVSYRRSFRPNNLRAGYAEAKMNIRTAASGELRITKLRLYFEQNNRPLIMVERNTRDLTGAIEIQYNGSGLFKGYWQVGNRILKRVQENVFYGKVMTLKTPKTPPLPTYSEGVHRLQFIITEPKTAAAIDFPEAFYHVETKRATIVAPITLNNPAKSAEITSIDEEFSWADLNGAQTYQISFYNNAGEESIFSAYTKNGSYIIHPRLWKLHFEEGKIYEWQVRSFNTAGEMNGESTKQKFTLAIQTTFVPGQVIFLVSNDNEGRVLIDKMANKYSLQIKEQVSLAALDQIMIIGFTEADITNILKELQGENGVYNAQPNYIFSTLESSDPLRTMQTIDEILDLDAIHQKLTGKNILIAIIDTGVDTTHKDLQQNIKEHLNFVAGTEYIGEIHGTGVAGIIAGTRNDFGILGIAPDAKIVALRACRQTTRDEPAAECLSASIAKAIDAAIVLHTDITNLSIGSSVPDPLVRRLITAGADSGMLFTAPVGNNPRAKNIAFPASHPKVNAVAGFNKAGSPFPNRELALRADAVAPAENIFSTTPGNHHNFMDGTSFSTATVTGILALSLEAGNTNNLVTFPKFDGIANWQSGISSFIGIQ